MMMMRIMMMIDEACVQESHQKQERYYPRKYPSHWCRIEKSLQCLKPSHKCWWWSRCGVSKSYLLCFGVDCVLVKQILVLGQQTTPHWYTRPKSNEQYWYWACPMYCNDDCWYVLLVVVMYRLNQFSLTNTTAAVECSELQTIDLCFPSFLRTEKKVFIW